MKLTQVVGLVFIVAGILIAVYGIHLIPLSVVEIGPIKITDIPGRSAASIGLGGFLVLVGIYLLVKGGGD